MFKDFSFVMMLVISMMCFCIFFDLLYLTVMSCVNKVLLSDLFVKRKYFFMNMMYFFVFLVCEIVVLMLLVMIIRNNMSFNMFDRFYCLWYNIFFLLFELVMAVKLFFNSVKLNLKQLNGIWFVYFI